MKSTRHLKSQTKTLVALAALAASTGVFAQTQVTVTGTLAMGYRDGSYLTNALNNRFDNATPGLSLNTNSVPGSNNSETSGLGVQTSEINFTANEDLGGGMKIVAKMGIVGADRGGAGNPLSTVEDSAGAISGGDASLDLSTAMGTGSLFSKWLPDYTTGSLGGTGAVGGVDLSGKVTLNRAMCNGIAYTFAPINSFIFSVFQVQGNALPGLAWPNPAGAAFGLGVGASGAPGTVNQRQNGVSVTYVIPGKLVVNAQLNSPDNRTTNTTVIPYTVTSLQEDDRLSGNYNFGFAKVGAAFDNIITTSGAQLLQSNYVVSVPFGALTLSANYATANLTGIDLGLSAFGPAFVAAHTPAALINGQKVGDGLAADYALSKRTHLLATYASWEQVVGAPVRSNETNLLLSHTF